MSLMEQRTVTYAVVSHVTLPISLGCAATIQPAETGSDLKERLQRLSDIPDTGCLYLLREFPDGIIRSQLLEDVGQLPPGNLSVKVVVPEGPHSIPEWQRSRFSGVDMGSNEDSSGNESGEEQYALMLPFGPQRVRNNRERAHELDEMNMKRMKEQKGRKLVGGLYTQGELLGMGQFPVYLATDQAGNTVAVKLVSSHIFDQDHEDLVKAEVSIMEHLDHPHLMKILAFHKEATVCTLVMQVANGDLIAYLQRCSNKFLPEHHGKTLAKHILLGVDHLHSKNIIHRDLKPGNTLLMSGEGGCLAVVSDYGCSKYITSYTRTLRMGTPGYQAPEQLRGGNYGKPVDIWAFGVIMYVALVGRHPFPNLTKTSLLAMRRDEIHVELPPDCCVSAVCRQFVSSCLTHTAKNRATAKQLLKHAWLEDADPVLPAL